MPDRVEVMLKDYEAMRAEVLQRLGARQTITTFFVPVAATLIGAGLSAEPLLTTVVLAFAVPFVCYQTIYLWMAETQAIRRVSRYLHQLSLQIEAALPRDAARQEPAVLTWEEQLRSATRKRIRPGFFHRHYVYNTLLFWVPAVTVAGWGCVRMFLYDQRLGFAGAAAQGAAFLAAVRAFRGKSKDVVAMYDDSTYRSRERVGLGTETTGPGS